MTQAELYEELLSIMSGSDTYKHLKSYAYIGVRLKDKEGRSYSSYRYISEKDLKDRSYTLGHEMNGRLWIEYHDLWHNPRTYTTETADGQVYRFGSGVKNDTK